MGSDFVESAVTESVNHYGAAILVEKSLGPDQQLFLSRAGNRAEAIARVIGQIGVKGGLNLYGIVLENAGSNFWGIKFPVPEDEEAPTVRMLLECNACETREIAYLSELELDVFQANKSISRSCGTCKQWTLWKQTLHDAPGPKIPATPVEPAPAAKVSNRRKHARMTMRMTACIKQPGRIEEVVDTADVSRGGMRFMSKHSYTKGAWIEVAMPYTPSAANIFVPGRVVHAQNSKREGVHEYGVEYVKSK